MMSIRRICPSKLNEMVISASKRPDGAITTPGSPLMSTTAAFFARVVNCRVSSANLGGPANDCRCSGRNENWIYCSDHVRCKKFEQGRDIASRVRQRGRLSRSWCVPGSAKTRGWVRREFWCGLGSPVSYLSPQCDSRCSRFRRRAWRIRRASRNATRSAGERRSRTTRSARLTDSARSTSASGPACFAFGRKIVARQGLATPVTRFERIECCSCGDRGNPAGEVCDRTRI